MTYSIVARDEATGRLGVAAQSCYFALGAVLPWARAGIGAVATQSMVDPGYGPRCLDLMASGVGAGEALNRVRAADEGRELRQVGVVGASGEVASFTGAQCITHVGHVAGAGYSAQANMMAGDGVCEAMAAAFESARSGAAGAPGGSASLAEQLVAALVAAEGMGGDARGRMSAALIVVDGARHEYPWQGVVIDVRVDHHDDPLGELARLVRVGEAYRLCDVAEEALAAGDMAGVLAGAEAGLALLPGEGNLLLSYIAALVGVGRIDEAAAETQELVAVHPPWEGILRSLLGTLLPMPEGVTVDVLLSRGVGLGPGREGGRVSLVRLPAQPDEVPWPTSDWPVGDVPAAAAADLEALLDRVCQDTGPLASTYAVVLIHRGRLVAERYQGQLDHFDRAPDPVTMGTPLLSWSMAKSMLHAVVGLLVADGLLDLDAPTDVPEWSSVDDPRHAITLRHLLAMRDGLDFVEDYVDEQVSDVIEMLFGAGQDDMARFAADRPLAAPPGERFNYSSGTSNIISGIVARVVGSGASYERFLRDRLFDPIGMRSATPELDPAGTWVASSTVRATARDFARFGLLYLRDGVWDGARVLPEGWVSYGRTMVSIDPADNAPYGAHWWGVAGDTLGLFRASGYDGQSITICPAEDLIVVRLGKTSSEHYADLSAWRGDVVAAFNRART